MLRHIRARTPVSLKRALRRTIVDPVKRRRDDWSLRRSIVRLRANDAPERHLIEALRRAWGNEGFSADVSYLMELAQRVARCRNPILECGSGITTLIAAVLTERMNLTVWSLEQDREWFEYASRAVERNRIQNVAIWHTPLREYDDFVWYDIERVDLPDRFDLVVCDGPAVSEEWGTLYAQWRYGVLPMLAARRIAFGEVMLDDAAEPRAAGLIDRWHREFGMQHQLFKKPDGDFALFKRESQG